MVFPRNKFVVNLFESRRSYRAKERRKPKWPAAGGVEIINDRSEQKYSIPTPESQRVSR